MAATTERPIPPTLLLALSSPLPSDPVRKGTTDSSSTSPIPSSTYVVRISSAEVTPSIPSARTSHSQPNRDSFLDPLAYSPSSPNTRETNPEYQPNAPENMDYRPSDDGSRDLHGQESDDIRTSEDVSAVSTYNRDSMTKSSVAGGAGRLSAVNENAGGVRRASHPSTFGGRDGASPVPSVSRNSPSFGDELTPAANAGRFSAANSDALRRQSMRSSRQSRDGAVRPPPSEKEVLARASEDDVNGRPSESYRLDFRTTSEGANGDTTYGSSTGHSEFVKKHEIPRSSYYVGPPAMGSAFGTEPMGTIGTHYPREIVRVERDYSGGELVQFYPTYPLEFEGRITPTKFQASINEINEVLISAYSLRHSALENVLGVVTLYLWTMLTETHYDKEMRRLAQLFDQLNKEVYNPAGLNLLWPRKVGFLFLEIEYY
ncbi:hypothetical protein FRC01_007662 [Tulasnella sp. 417]|nr:hypothetical protein FRC01_007662 [Tulasnella sp. 417]